MKQFLTVKEIRKELKVMHLLLDYYGTKRCKREVVLRNFSYFSKQASSAFKSHMILVYERYLRIIKRQTTCSQVT